MSTNNEPALPWAAQPKDAETDSADAVELSPSKAEDIKGLTLEEAGIAVGDRLEVKWHVEPEADGEEAYERWWGATVVGPSSQRDPQHPEFPVFQITYEAHEGFEQEEQAHVVFTEEHALRQLDQEEALRWRRAGDAWEPEEEEDSEEEGDELVTLEPGDTISMDDLRKNVDRKLQRRLGGRSLDEVEAEALATLQPSQQIAVAAGFRDFAENLKSFLSEQVAPGADGSLTVTADHIQDFMRSLRAKRQRTE